MARCLYQSLLKNEDKHFYEILDEVNDFMKKIELGHQNKNNYQTIEYRAINMKIMKLYFTTKKEIQKMEILMKETQKFVEKYNEILIKEFQGEFDNIFGKKVYIDESKKEIQIDEIQEIHLKRLFKFISAVLPIQKMGTFYSLIISNNLLESIDENILDGISFNKISINKCPKLKRIHWNAFGNEAEKVLKLNVWEKLPNLISEKDTDYDLWKLINSLVNCKEISVNSFDYELKKINLNKLRTIDLDGHDSSIKIKSICDLAFYECDKIEKINLSWNNITIISENAFRFRNENDKELLINLWENKLNEYSFKLNSLNNFKRPTNLDLRGNKIKYLDEKVFKPFLDLNENNGILFTKTFFEVNFIENQWNQKIEYAKQINFLYAMGTLKRMVFRRKFNDDKKDEKDAEMIKENEAFLKSIKNSNINESNYTKLNTVVRKFYINVKEKIIQINPEEELDLKILFKIISDILHILKMDKHFNSLLISNDLLESIDENILQGISFNEIIIFECPKLQRIHWNAFGNEVEQIIKFNGWKNLPKLRSERNTDYDLWKFINSLSNCEELHINPFQNDLQPIKLNMLKILDFDSLDSLFKIKSICDFAFYECDVVEEINLSWNNISFISENAFHFRNENDKKLKIYLCRNKLNESSFALNSLINFKRSVKFDFSWNEIRYLDKKVFKPFLDTNSNNGIWFINKYFQINYKEHQWHQRLPYAKQIKISSAEMRLIRETKNVIFVKIPLKQLFIEGIESDFEKIKKEILMINENSFDDLIINNPNIKILKSQTFSSHFFNEIKISKSAEKLHLIEPEAFGPGSRRIQRLEILNDLPAKISKEKLLQLINSFTNIKEINMSSPKEFKGQLNLLKLKSLIIDGSHSINKLKSISDFIFSKCRNLMYIDLSNNELGKITKNMFNFENKSNELLILDLSNNKLSELSFDESSLTNINRPLQLILNKNQIKYLDANIFNRFFNDYSKNIIYYYNDTLYNSLDYGNTKNEWLFKDENIVNKKVFGIQNLIKHNDYVFFNQKKDQIFLIGKNKFNMRSTFGLMQKKLIEFNYKMLLIENEAIDVIDENTFGKFNFEEIQIANCKNLTRIHKNAFGKNAKNVKKFYAWNKLNNLLSVRKSNHDLLKLINSLVNCEKIMVSSFGKTIYSIKLKKLQLIIFDGQFSKIKIQNIEDNTFYECERIKLINLKWNQIKTLKANAFALRNKSSEFLNIDLSNNLLNESSFDSFPFENIERPIKLWLNHNEIKYYKENIFIKFFQNELNQIIIEEELDLNHNSNKWLKSYNKQIILV